MFFSFRFARGKVAIMSRRKKVIMEPSKSFVREALTHLEQLLMFAMLLAVLKLSMNA